MATSTSAGYQDSMMQNPYLAKSGMPGWPVPLTDEANGALTQAGVQPPTSIQQSPFFSNAIMSTHPRLFGALSGAMSNIAATPQPQGIEGAGGGMQRTMEGIMGGPQLNRQFQVQQMMAPFSMAENVQGLKAGQADLARLRALVPYYQQRSLPTNPSEMLAQAVRDNDPQLEQAARSMLMMQHGNNSASLAKIGMQMGPDGNISPLDDKDISPELKNQRALSQSIADRNEAIAGLNKSKSDPNSLLYKQQMLKLEQAEERIKIQLGNLGVRTDEFNLNTFGTVGGQAVPGSTVDENGKPIGWHAPANPTTKAKSAADNAQTLQNMAPNLITMIRANAASFGPAPGRAAEFSRWLGSQPPAVQQTYTQLKQFGKLAGLPDDVMGTLKTNPDALIASIQGALTTAAAEKKTGTTARGGQSSSPTQPPPGAKHIGVSSVDHKKYYLDADGKKLGPAE